MKWFSTGVATVIAAAAMSAAALAQTPQPTDANGLPLPSVDQRAYTITVETGTVDSPAACDADRAVITYLQSLLTDPETSYQERSYIPSKLQFLRHDLRLRHCSAS